jgi:hypothetical protein
MKRKEMDHGRIHKQTKQEDDARCEWDLLGGRKPIYAS